MLQNQPVHQSHGSGLMVEHKFDEDQKKCTKAGVGEDEVAIPQSRFSVDLGSATKKPLSS